MVDIIFQFHFDYYSAIFFHTSFKSWFFTEVLRDRKSTKVSSVVYSYAHACTRHNNKDGQHGLLEKYSSLFIWKGCVCEGVGDRTELQHINLHTLLAITAFLSRSPGLLNQGPGGPASLGHVPQSSILFLTRLIPNCSIGGPLCWVLAFSTASYLQLVWSPN